MAKLLLSLASFAAILSAPLAANSRQLEPLSRGLVAVAQPDGRVFLSWRLLATDAPGLAFNVYRTTTPAPDARPDDFGIYASLPAVPAGTVKLNPAPLTAGTWFIDPAPALHHATAYAVRPVLDGIEIPDTRPAPSVSPTLSASSGFSFQLSSFIPSVPPRPYHRLPLQNPPGYLPVEASPGDLDGDGDYELILMQAGIARDNSHSGLTDPPILQAYRLDGTLLWQINLGPNIRAGAHYTQFIVFDLDGDGRAELACKTADGTTDGLGRVLGDPAARHVNASGHVLAGPEFLTVFDGLTGAALDTVPYEPARHPTNPLAPTRDELKAVWGDANGNRSDRYLAGVAYLDGARPSLIMARGYYTRSTLAAYDFRAGKLAKRWLFDSHAGPASDRAYAGQGNHSLSVADVDADGRDEIVYGAAVIDDDGTGLHSTGWGHGDALHVSDFDYTNPGLEVVAIQERFSTEGLSLRDAATGRPLFTVPSRKAADSGGDKGEGPGRGLAADIDPRFPGAELWAIGAGLADIYAADGTVIAPRPAGLPANFAVWWDGDLLRELLDQNFVAKWNWETRTADRLLTAHECVSSNGTKATPVLSADLWGDWREEIVWRTRDGSALHLYTSTIPTPHRLVTLMHDTQYRCAVAWQNVAYNQPPHPGFALREK